MSGPPDERVCSRRELLAGGFLARLLRGLGERTGRAEALLARSERPSAPPLLRPPGAIAEPAFLAACTRCGDCMRACPHGAIRLAEGRLRGAAGTPVVDPVQAPCAWCEGMPCIAACAPAALRRAPGRPAPPMGTARIERLDCLAHQGTGCSACRERCPVPGAIVLDGRGPRIEPAACTGCGTCQHVCPAPRNAVLVLPAQSRG